MAKKSAKKSLEPTPQANTAGVVVLQWLTYAFWGWLVAGLTWVIALIFVHALTPDPVHDSIPYAIAATVVMLPIAFLCDLFYRRFEPVKKHGGAMVIMVIHAVLFALLGIAALITAVFVGVSLLVNVSSDLTSQLIVIYTALIATVLFAGAFVRTLSPFKKPIGKLYAFSMLGVSLILLVLAVAGPVASSVQLRDDRRIETHLYSVNYAVQDYITTHETLPASLNDVDFTTHTDARALVDENKVAYKAVGLGEVKTGATDNAVEYRYELCVTYIASNERAPQSPRDGTQDYQVYLSVSPHGEGYTCYKLATIVRTAHDI